MSRGSSQRPRAVGASTRPFPHLLRLALLAALALGGVGCEDDALVTAPRAPVARTPTLAAIAPTLSPGVAPLEFRQMSTGGYHTCGVTTNDVAYCWGLNSTGQLGIGADLSPVPAAVSGALAFRMVTAGSFHTCGLTPRGNAYCWGDNSDGQLGDGTTTTRTTPMQVAGGLTFASLSAGGRYSCGVTTGQIGYCWGSNGDGQLGDGSQQESWVPVRVQSAEMWREISAGYAHTCGVTTTDAVLCWGSNWRGSVGIGDSSTRFRASPTPVLGGPGSWRTVDAGSAHSCGLSQGGDLWCWGYNNGGQVGDGTTTDRYAPTYLHTSVEWDQVRAGNATSCAVLASLPGYGPYAYCWGWNGYGQIGDGTTTQRPYPRSVNGGLRFSDIDTNLSHTCGVTTVTSGNHAAYCWGFNLYGQLGDGTTTQRLTPVAVAPVPELAAIASYIAEDVGTIPDSYLYFIRQSGYRYLLAIGNSFQYSSGPSDWQMTNGQPNGYYDWSASGTKKLYQSLKRLFVRADRRNLQVIPGFSVGSGHSGSWNTTNASIEINSINSEGEVLTMTPMAPDPDGIDRSFASYVGVVFRAFRAARTTHRRNLDYIHIGHDEMADYVSHDFLIANNSQRDRDWLVQRHQAGLSYEEAYYELIADEIARRVRTVRDTAAKYGQNTRVILWADMFDPQFNGDPMGNRDPQPFTGWTPAGRVAVNAMHVLTRASIRAVRDHIVLMPWQYAPYNPFGDPYDAAATLSYFAANGFRQIIPASSYVSGVDPDLTNGRAMMREWVRVSSLPQFEGIVIGQCAANWWENAQDPYWRQQPRPVKFQIVPELAMEAGFHPPRVASSTR
jgi:alpha-tubulin suppressor-like RCC1 family protein